MAAFERVLELAGHALEHREVAAGAVIHEAGVPNDALIRVRTGRLEAVIEGSRPVVVRVLESGDTSGGACLLPGAVTPTTLTAVTDVCLDALPASAGRVILEDRQELARDVAAAVRGYVNGAGLAAIVADLLDTEDDALVRRVVEQLDIAHVDAGAALWRQGDHADAAYLVITGQLSISQHDDDAGDEVELTRICRGQIVGEAALLDGARRYVTAVATRDTVVARLDESTFQALIASDPRAMNRVTRLIVERMMRPRPADPRAVSIVAVASAVGSTEKTVDELRRALAVHGRGYIVRSSDVDDALGAPGAAAADVREPSGARADARLHELEVLHDLLLLVVDDLRDGWAQRAMNVADRVVVVVDHSGDTAQCTWARHVRERTPATTPVIAVAVHPAGTERPRGAAGLRDALEADDLLHVRDGSHADLARVARLVTGNAVALVLGGGGARGFAHVGVFTALVERGVPVDLVVGSSIGAPLGGGIACGYDPRTLHGVTEELFRGLLDYTLPVVALLKGAKITRSICRQFEQWDFEDLWIPFRCVTTNLTWSRTDVHSRGSVAAPVRASVAIPGLLPPVPLDGDLHIDGGVLNNLPVDVAAVDGRCSTIIAVDVASPRGPRARREFGLSVSGVTALREAVTPGRSSLPSMAAVLARSVMISSTRDRPRLLADARVDLLLEPTLTGVGLLDFGEVAPVARMGNSFAGPHIDEWLLNGGWSKHGRQEEKRGFRQGAWVPGPV